MLSKDAQTVLMWMKTHLRYEDGELYCVTKFANKVNVGDVIGSRHGTGYIQTQLDGQKFFVHRLIWLWHYNDWPTGFIDHIDGDRSNNRVENLRDASPKENSLNRVNSREHAYITPYDEKYSIQISDDMGTTVLYVSVRTLEEAIAIRDYWISNFM